MEIRPLFVYVVILNIPGFSVTAPWAFIWFLDGNENKIDISTVGTNGNFFLINAHGVLRRMGAVTEIPFSKNRKLSVHWKNYNMSILNNIII